MHNIKVTQTDKGHHADHWHGIYGKQYNTQHAVDRSIKAIQTGKKYEIGNSTYLIVDPLIRSIAHHNIAVTGFPYVKGSTYGQFSVVSVQEWSHTKNLEAVITARHTSGCALYFFATDYAFHKNIYKTQKKLSINVVGLVYDLCIFDVESWSKNEHNLIFNADFCGYFPKTGSPEEIKFMGRIQHMREHTVGEISGQMITVGITPDFAMEFFVANITLSPEIQTGTQVEGIAWIQGTLEKE